MTDPVTVEEVMGKPLTPSQKLTFILEPTHDVADTEAYCNAASLELLLAGKAPLASKMVARDLTFVTDFDALDDAGQVLVFALVKTGFAKALAGKLQRLPSPVSPVKEGDSNTAEAARREAKFHKATHDMPMYLLVEGCTLLMNFVDGVWVLKKEGLTQAHEKKAELIANFVKEAYKTDADFAANFANAPECVPIYKSWLLTTTAAALKTKTDGLPTPTSANGNKIIAGKWLLEDSIVGKLGDAAVIALLTTLAYYVATDPSQRQDVDFLIAAQLVYEGILDHGHENFGKTMKSMNNSALKQRATLPVSRYAELFRVWFPDAIADLSKQDVDVPRANKRIQREPTGVSGALPTSLAGVPLSTKFSTLYRSKFCFACGLGGHMLHKPAPNKHQKECPWHNYAEFMCMDPRTLPPAALTAETAKQVQWIPKAEVEEV